MSYRDKAFDSRVTKKLTDVHSRQPIALLHGVADLTSQRFKETVHFSHLRVVGYERQHSLYLLRE